MAANTPGAPATPANDALPPVEPPSAGFIVQLFVVPAVIVVIIVVVWGLFNWLAQMGSNPQSYVAALERDNSARWQAASSLADALNNPRHEEFKRDTSSARRLVAILNREIEQGSMEENPLALRVFLCRALGEMLTPEVLPALVQVAQSNRDPREVEVRLAAVEALAVFALNTVGNGSSHDEPTAGSSPRSTGAVSDQDRDMLTRALVSLSRDDDPRIRSRSAYALGVAGGHDAQARLTTMLADAYPDARYNAATGLARHGDAAAAPVLIEMLDPTQTAGSSVEQLTALRGDKQLLIMKNALEATGQLAQRNAKDDLSVLRSAVETVADTNTVSERLRVLARSVLELMQPRSPAAASN